MAPASTRSVVLIAALIISLFASSASAAPAIGLAMPRHARASLPALAVGCPPFPGATAFVNRIDNRYFPLFPGTTYVYKGAEDGEVQGTVVEVTTETKTILGVPAVVVRDTVTDRKGGLIEQTLDWFAQDQAGNVWYLGEDSKEYENGVVVSTAGSWEAGVNGAQPGIVMEGNPQPGDAYSQECAPGEAEDQAAVLKRNASVKTPFASFGHALLTNETTPLEPGTAENKFYAQCVGLVRSVDVKGGNAESSLVAVKNGPSRAELGCKDKKNKNKNNHKNNHKKQQKKHHHR